MKSEKEKMYEKLVKKVEKLVAEGMTITAARTAVSAQTKISYPTIVKITKNLETNQ